jgi:hypothetical protein
MLLFSRGLYIDNQLSWREQVSGVVSRTYSTLWFLYRFQRNTSRDLRIYLVRSLIIPIFLYTDVVYFPSLTGLKFRRLELAFNACTRYVFGLDVLIIQVSFRRVFVVTLCSSNLS